MYTRPDLPEDSDSGTTVIVISASDRDLGAGGQVRYDIVSGKYAGRESCEVMIGGMGGGLKWKYMSQFKR